MHKSGSCWQITFEEKETYDEALTGFLDEYFDVTACDYTDGGFEQYIGYKSQAFNEKDFIKQSGHVQLPKYEITLLEEKNWLAENVIEFPPIETGDFLIYGIHEKQEPETKKIPIKIYAATAFGSNHQTTKTCLQALSDLKKTNPENILDVGTGSGILSLAAAKLWPNSQIIAVDIDEESVIVTNRNACTNNVDNRINAFQSDGYKKVKGSFDLILANILARPLISMAEDLGKHLKKGGRCILSGFNEEQLNWVADAHKEQGLELKKIYKEDTWRTVLMEKTK